MGIAGYEIVGSENEWRIQHDGKAENVYTTKESVAAASLALRQSHEMRIGEDLVCLMVIMARR